MSEDARFRKGFLLALVVAISAAFVWPPSFQGWLTR